MDGRPFPSSFSLRRRRRRSARSASSMTRDTPPLAQPPSPAAQAIELAAARSASLPKALPQAPRAQPGKGPRRLVLRVGGVRAIHQRAEGRQWAASQLSLKALKDTPQQGKCRRRARWPSPRVSAGSLWASPRPGGARCGRSKGGEKGAKARIQGTKGQHTKRTRPQAASARGLACLGARP